MTGGLPSFTCPDCGRMHEATTFRVFGCSVNWPWVPGATG